MRRKLIMFGVPFLCIALTSPVVAKKVSALPSTDHGPTAMTLKIGSDTGSGELPGDDDPTDAREFVRDIRSGLSSDEVGSVWLDNGTIVVSVTARSVGPGDRCQTRRRSCTESRTFGLRRLMSPRVTSSGCAAPLRLRRSLTTLPQGVLAFGTDSSSGQLRLSVTAAKGRLEERSVACALGSWTGEASPPMHLCYRPWWFLVKVRSGRNRTP